MTLGGAGAVGGGKGKGFLSEVAVRPGPDELKRKGQGRGNPPDEKFKLYVKNVKADRAPGRPVRQNALRRARTESSERGARSEEQGARSKEERTGLDHRDKALRDAEYRCSRAHGLPP